MSDNFKRETERRERPSCYGKHKTESVKDRLKCGMCWFSHECQEVKVIAPPKTPDKKKVNKK